MKRGEFRAPLDKLFKRNTPTTNFAIDFSGKVAYTESASFFTLSIVSYKILVGTYQIGNIFLCSLI